MPFNRRKIGFSYLKIGVLALLLLVPYASTVPVKAADYRFEFTLFYGAGRYAMDQQIVEAVQSFLAEVDINMKIESHDWASFAAAQRESNRTKLVGDYQAWFVGFGNPWMNADGALKNFISQRGLEPLFYNNTHYDDLFVQSRKEANEANLMDLYEEMNDIVMTDAPWIFLAIEPNLHAAKSVQGITTYHDESVDIFDAYSETSNDTLTLSLGTEPVKFDPQHTSGMSNLGIVRLVCETLVKLDQETGDVVPVLAESWSTDSSAENWTINIRQGVYFHDGSELTAEDVKYTLWDRLASPDSGALASSSFGPPSGPIKNITVLSKYQLKIETIGFAALMPFFNYQPSEIVSKTQCDALHKANETVPGEDFQTDPSGTGPYKFVEWVKGDHITLQRNENYWGKKPAFQTVIMKKITDSASRVTALLAGDVDYIHQAPTTAIDTLMADPEVYMIKAASVRMMHIGLNHDFEIFKNRKVRQALNYAVNQTKMVETLYSGYGSAMIDTMMAPNAYGVQEGNVSYEQDIEMAKQLLDEAGYPVPGQVTPSFEFPLVMIALALMMGKKAFFGRKLKKKN
ncbi:MAG: ABC transporter substrate-binding protein [Candidatus Thorarchaeota archaeon]